HLCDNAPEREGFSNAPDAELHLRRHTDKHASQASSQRNRLTPAERTDDLEAIVVNNDGDKDQGGSAKDKKAREQLEPAHAIKRSQRGAATRQVLCHLIPRLRRASRGPGRSPVTVCRDDRHPL